MVICGDHKIIISNLVLEKLLKIPKNIPYFPNFMILILIIINREATSGKNIICLISAIIRISWIHGKLINRRCFVV